MVLTREQKKVEVVVLEGQDVALLCIETHAPVFCPSLLQLLQVILQDVMIGGGVDLPVHAPKTLTSLVDW